MREVAVLGVGMHPWGKFPGKSFVDLGVDATLRALKDAGVEWTDIQAVACGIWPWGGMPGQLAGHELAAVMGETGVPIINVSNACATAGSTFRAAHQMIALGVYDIALAVGLDMSPEGFFPAVGGTEDINDRDFLRWRMAGVSNPAFWALECRRRMEEYGTTETQLAKVKVKNSKAGAINPNARYRRKFSLEEVLLSPMVCDPLRLFEICATSDGAAAMVLCSMDIAKQRTSKPIRIAAATLGSSLFGDATTRIPFLSGRAQALAPKLSESAVAVKTAYEQAGLGPEDLDFVELPDNSSWHELVYSEIVGLCKPGEAERLLDEGVTELGGKIPVCPSGGVSSFGEAVAAQHLAMVCELVWQLRGESGARQVPNARVGLAQSYGAQGNSATIILTT
ncbi:MAG: lipid-transfer protein [Chloroflexi bacterium]|nr:lipid-transfer protein [Chloroflexota bacterium]